MKPFWVLFEAFARAMSLTLRKKDKPSTLLFEDLVANGDVIYDRATHQYVSD